MIDETHDYTPKGFLDTANTLSCHQMAGLSLEIEGTNITPTHMGKFQAQHLLEAGYVIIYAPNRAAQILDSGKRFGHIGS